MSHQTEASACEKIRAEIRSAEEAGNITILPALNDKRQTLGCKTDAELAAGDVDERVGIPGVAAEPDVLDLGEGIKVIEGLPLFNQGLRNFLSQLFTTQLATATQEFGGGLFDNFLPQSLQALGLSGLPGIGTGNTNMGQGPVFPPGHPNHPGGGGDEEGIVVSTDPSGDPTAPVPFPFGPSPIHAGAAESPLGSSPLAAGVGIASAGIQGLQGLKNLFSGNDQKQDIIVENGARFEPAFDTGGNSLEDFIRLFQLFRLSQTEGVSPLGASAALPGVQTTDPATTTTTTTVPEGTFAPNAPGVTSTGPLAGRFQSQLDALVGSFAQSGGRPITQESLLRSFGFFGAGNPQNSTTQLAANFDPSTNALFQQFLATNPFANQGAPAVGPVPPTSGPKDPLGTGTTTTTSSPALVTTDPVGPIDLPPPILDPTQPNTTGANPIPPNNALAQIIQQFSLPSFQGGLSVGSTPLQQQSTDFASEFLRNNPLAQTGGATAALDDIIGGGSRFDLSPQFQALEDINKRRLGEERAQINERFGLSGGRFGSDVANAQARATADFLERESLQRADLSRQSFESAAARRLQAIPIRQQLGQGQLGLAERAFGIGQQTQSAQERDLIRQLTEFARTQGGLFPLLLQFALAGTEGDTTVINPDEV